MKGPLLSDLDGTIVDTAPAIFESMRRTCAEIGLKMPGERDLSWALGPPLHWCLGKLGVRESQMAEAISVFERAHLELIDLCKPMPGADAVLSELAGAGVAIGVATIKPQPLADLVLSSIGLRDHVAALHGRTDDLDPRTKTDLLRAVAAELGGSSAVYVGDHDNDEDAALDLGIPFFRYPATSWMQIRSVVLGV